MIISKDISMKKFALLMLIPLMTAQTKCVIANDIVNEAIRAASIVGVGIGLLITFATIRANKAMNPSQTECDKVFTQANSVMNDKTHTADFLKQLTQCQQLYENGKVNKYDSRSQN
jgi:hypothetical protein